MSAGAEGEALHASCVAVGEAAILIRGASGAGKSQLALALLDAARAEGRFARLVGDDRVLVAARAGRLVARPHPRLAGLVERRGLGLAPVPHEAAAVVALVVDCGERGERMPEPADLVAEVAGVTLPRLRLAGEEGDARRALAALRLFCSAQEIA